MVRSFIVAVLLVAAASTSVPLVDAQQPAQTPLAASSAPAALVTAIDAYAQAHLSERPYLGADCSQGTSTADGGKWCWSLLGIDGSSARVGFAVTNSDTGVPAVTFVRASTGAWLPQGAIGAPSVGSGVLPPDGGPVLETWQALLGVLALASGAVLTLRARRRSSP